MRRRITEALAHSRYYTGVQEGLRCLDFKATMAALDRAIKSSHGTTRNRMARLLAARANGALARYVVWSGKTNNTLLI